MAWKPTGRPTARQQREKWVVRVDGVDMATGKVRPRQLGTFESQRAATAFASSGEAGSDRSTVDYVVDEWVPCRTDVTPKTKLQYE